MNRYTLLCVGKTEQGFIGDGVNFYLKRIRPFHDVSLLILRAAAHSGRNQQLVLAQEAARVLQTIPEGDWMILLDEKGKACSSRQFSSRLKGLAETGRKVTFVIGGAHGVHQSLRARADEMISLSAMTMPHQLVRVVFLEQLYRAFTILAGHGYHHD